MNEGSGARLAHAEDCLSGKPVGNGRREFRRRAQIGVEEGVSIAKRGSRCVNCESHSSPEETKNNFIDRW
jgi:hypothetical protein